MSKYIIVVGGVISGCGKGIAAASMGLLMKMRGHKVQLLKCDPYLNINAGTMNPRQHGEVFLCNDSSETDLDLGHYERITGIEVSAENIFTSGTLYKEILHAEEEGKYLGQTVQVIPHITDKIQQKLTDIGQKAEIVIVEIGGTVGDLESGPFLEAIRQFKQKNPLDVMVVMVSPILWINTIKEFKTKPLQNSVKDLQRFGLQPEILLCRVDKPIPAALLDKVSHLTNVPREAVFDAPDVNSVYQVPIELYDRHVDDLIADKFHLKRNGCRIHKYKDLVERYNDNGQLPEVCIGIVGKYDNCDEAYLSLKEAIYHAAVAHDVKAKIKWIQSAALESAKRGEVANFFQDVDAVVVPGGFDNRGVAGKIRAITHCRTNKVPFLGICLGLQCAVIEFAQEVCGLKEANSMEFNAKTPHPVIHFIPGQETIKKKCGTMRLGAFDCELAKGSTALDLYKRKVVSERHRHRYEVNNEYTDRLKNQGFYVTGRNPGTDLVEIMELDRKIHPFFLGTQAHPEFQSRLGDPNPIFYGLIDSAVKFSQKVCK